jgi:hypothetical protein
LPRYFFHIQGGLNVPDEEGTVLPGPEQARAQAAIAAGELLRDLDGSFWDNSEWQMLVIDELGRTVCTLTIKGSTERH